MRTQRWVGGRRLLACLVVLGGGAPAALSAHADALAQFGRETVLPGSAGAEPSLVVDHSQTASQNDIYVTAINPGPNLWHSYDGGQTWSSPVPFDTNGTAPGGDADVSVGGNGTVFV